MSRRDLLVVGGGLTGLWTALLASEREPGRASRSCWRARRVAFGASGRNGGFCDASLTHGLGERARPLAGRDAAAGADGPGEPRRDRGDDRAARDRRGLGARPGSWPSPPSRTRCRGWPRRSQTARRFGWDSEVLDREAAQAEVRLPHLPRRGLAPGRHRDGRPGPDRLGPGGCGRGSGCADLRAHARSCGSSATAPGRGALPGRPGHGTPRGARDQRVPAAGARDPPLRGARVRLRAGHRAARRRTGGRRWGGGGARGSATPATSSTITG